ncbi:hypothetical protein ACFL27_25525 [candidate division CSSED10-310 bacterium]|uniref:Uncharacterized protein n=1 Tax=candidate division CSSED10-310 bacterium TaxID=2855610 RepID=A0ABV6Z554_UNCC1
MEWKEIPSEQKWVLRDNGDIAAAIYAIDKDGVKNRFQAKTIISAIYLGKKRFSKLEKKHQDWLSSKKKFTTLEARQRYIQNKMRAISKYIHIRIS